MTRCCFVQQRAGSPADLRSHLIDPLDWEEKAIQAMRDEVSRLLADALRVADETRDETDRVTEETRVETDQAQHAHDDGMSAAQKDHTDEMTAAQERHDGETAAAQSAHDDEMRSLEAAIASGDVLGQAKGIIMVAMSCDAERAFDLIRKQSQAENRKTIEVAAEIVAKVARRAER